ncbi:MAG TPA: helix-turn-helix domain-containing protein [Pseudonocardia sp.]|nr:helix-turn-helix domain-containing protein [Pseudonocardia sp.]
MGTPARRIARRADPCTRAGPAPSRALRHTAAGGHGPAARRPGRPRHTRRTRPRGRCERTDPQPPLPHRTRESFRAWRTQLRIQHALVLLAQGDSVQKTANACGWSNPSSFIDAFTAVLGDTPGRYRAQAR